MKFHCPCCDTKQPATHFACQSGAKGGKAKSDQKVAAARANGKKGGRPKKPANARWAKDKKS